MTRPGLHDPSAEGGHLDLDGLADLLSARGADRADASAGADGGFVVGGAAEVHLATCGGCTARLAELEAAEHLVVSALVPLGDLPLPADVAQRLASALAGEPALVPAAPAASAAGDPGPSDQGPSDRGASDPGPSDPGGPGRHPAPLADVVPLAGRRRRPWLPVAASLVLVAGGLLGYGLLTGGPGGSADMATTTASGARPEAGAAAPVPTVASGLDYADPVAVAAGLRGVLSGRAGAAGNRPSATPDPAAVTVVDPLARLRDPAALADCLAALVDPAAPDERPLALDYATYRGAPALAVVLPDTDPARVSVFVVGPTCSRAADGLLFFTRLPRP